MPSRIRVNKDGEVLGIQPMKRLNAESPIERKREYTRTKLEKPVRSRRPTPVRFGQDPLEQRASQYVSGSILERIVYQKLSQLLGPEGSRWQFKEGVLNARLFAGGFEIDFVINNPVPIALEVQGAFWHGPAAAFRDVARALVLMGLGYDYVEITETDIISGDEYLEQRLVTLLGIY